MELLQVLVPRTHFVEAARSLIGCRWGEVTDFDHTSCIGVPLLALRGVGLTERSFDANLSDVPPHLRLAWLLRLLHRNAHAVESWFDVEAKGALLPGDLLLSRWTDADVTRSVVHHVAIFTANQPYPYGTQIQSLAREHGGAGMVYEAPMSALDWHRVEAVWRLNALTDESNTDGKA